MTASMLDDVERRRRTEADHILGDLLRRRGPTPTDDHSLLRLAYVAVKAAETRAAREAHVSGE
jgi:2-dehydropantoate 2-reductase